MLAGADSCNCMQCRDRQSLASLHASTSILALLAVMYAMFASISTAQHSTAKHSIAWHTATRHYCFRHCVLSPPHSSGPEKIAGLAVGVAYVEALPTRLTPNLVMAAAFKFSRLPSLPNMKVKTGVLLCMASTLTRPTLCSVLIWHMIALSTWFCLSLILIGCKQHTTGATPSDPPTETWKDPACSFEDTKAVHSNAKPCYCSQMTTSVAM